MSFIIIGSVIQKKHTGNLGKIPKGGVLKTYFIQFQFGNFGNPINEEETHFIWPPQCQYDFSYVYLRGLAAVNIF